MPFPTLSVPTFPDVPDLPGVPALLRDPLAPSWASPDLLTQDSQEIDLADKAAPIWGLYDAGGAPVLVSDNVASFEQNKEYRILDYPTERGGFESYNKVEVPGEIRLAMTKGGSESERSDFLTQLSAIAGDRNLYTAVTPERSYSNVNVIHQDYARRSDRGANLLIVDVWLQQVRLSAVATFTSSQEPTGQDPQNLGPVQPGAVDDPPAIEDLG